jgi:cysteine-rich repeat protein
MHKSNLWMGWGLGAALVLAGCGDDGTTTATTGLTMSAGTTTSSTTASQTSDPGTTEAPTTTDTPTGTGTTTTGPSGETTTADTTTTATTAPEPFCGDGNVDDGEECDDGDMSDADECTNACKNAVCGDGIIGPGEECDDANADDGDTCTTACKSAACGDAFVLVGVEECDDGNQDDADGCTNACKNAACGDGILGPGEMCDDGNQIDDDACTNTCAPASCGDAKLQVGEECDDGNKSNASLAKHPETTAPSLPGPFRCLAGFLRSPPGPDRARFAVATTREAKFLATLRQPGSRARRSCVAKRCQKKRASGAFPLQAVAKKVWRQRQTSAKARGVLDGVRDPRRRHEPHAQGDARPDRRVRRAAHSLRPRATRACARPARATATGRVGGRAC